MWFPRRTGGLARVEPAPKPLPNPPTDIYIGDGTNLKAGCPADNLSELEVVPNPEQRDMAQWSDESGESGGESDSDEDESCSWLYQ